MKKGGSKRDPAREQEGDRERACPCVCACVRVYACVCVVRPWGYNTADTSSCVFHSQGATTALISPKMREMLGEAATDGAAVRGLGAMGETLRQKVTIEEGRCAALT